MKKASVQRQMFKVREVSDRVKGSPPASVASQLSSRTCLGNITLEVVKTLGMARSGIKVLKGQDVKMIYARHFLIIVGVGRAQLEHSTFLRSYLEQSTTQAQV